VWCFGLVVIFIFLLLITEVSGRRLRGYFMYYSGYMISQIRNLARQKSVCLSRNVLTSTIVKLLL